VSYSLKIVGSGNIPPSYVKLKVQSASSATDPTRVNIINTLHSVARQIPKSTHLDLKKNKGNHILTCLNAFTARGITKLTPTSVHSRSITSTKNSMLRNTRKSETIKPSQFA